MKSPLFKKSDDWGHSGWRYARKQIGLFAGMAYGRLRGSGVRVMTYVDDVLQSDPFAPGLGATKKIIFDIFWFKNLYRIE